MVKNRVSNKNKYLLDANILIRYLTKDNHFQFKIAEEYIKKASKHQIIVYVTSLVLHEVTHILENVYKHNRKDIVNALYKLLKFRNVEVLDLSKLNVIKALDDYLKHKIDFPDCIYNQIALENNLSILTFDKHFKKLNVSPLQSSKR